MKSCFIFMYMNHVPYFIEKSNVWWICLESNWQILYWQFFALCHSECPDWHKTLGLYLWFFLPLGNHGDLWECILMLEAASQQSRSNPQILLLLMKLYGWLGAIDQCTQSYNRLSIKYIQIDSIGWVGVAGGVVWVCISFNCRY